jgi:hypothetical protein
LKQLAFGPTWSESIFEAVPKSREADTPRESFSW